MYFSAAIFRTKTANPTPFSMSKQDKDKKKKIGKEEVKTLFSEYTKMLIAGERSDIKVGKIVNQSMGAKPRNEILAML